MVEKDCYCGAPCDCVLCKVCGESWTSNDDGLCRSCNIDGLLADWPCCPCGSRLYNPCAIVGPQPHIGTCPHAETGAYDPVREEAPPLDAVADAYARGYRAGMRSAGHT